MSFRLSVLPLLFAALAWSDTLTVTLDSVQVSATPGGAVTFSGTITNNSSASVSINGVGLNLANFDPTNYDATPFLLNAPVTLAAGGTSADFAFFTVSIPNGFSPGVYVGSMDVQGGATSTDFNLLGTGDFALNVAISIPPVLSIVKTHADNFAPGQQNATYTVIVSNSAGAGPTSGVVTVTETIPAGLTLVSMSGSGWSCPAGGNTCTTGAVLNAGAAYPPIVVTTNVSPSAQSSFVNQVSVTGGGISTAATGADLTIVSPYSACDVSQFGSTTVADVQQAVNQALGLAVPVNDMDNDGAITVADIQIVMNALLGMGCTGSF